LVCRSTSSTSVCGTSAPYYETREQDSRPSTHESFQLEVHSVVRLAYLRLLGSKQIFGAGNPARLRAREVPHLQWPHPAVQRSAIGIMRSNASASELFSPRRPAWLQAKAHFLPASLQFRRPCSFQFLSGYDPLGNFLRQPVSSTWDASPMPFRRQATSGSRSSPRVPPGPAQIV